MNVDWEGGAGLDCKFGVGLHAYSEEFPTLCFFRLEAPSDAVTI